MEKLAYTYHHVDEDGGLAATYLAGTPKSELPDNVVAKLKDNRLAFTAGEPGEEPGLAVLGVAPAPPLTGKGSGINAWRSFAEDHLAEVPDDWNRDEIVAKLQEDGIIGEDGALIE